MVMSRRPADFNSKQLMRDLLFSGRRVHLDTRYILRDGKRHPLAVICPGGGYQMVCSFIEGVPIAEKLNQKGISAVIVYYRIRKHAAYPAPQDDLAKAVKRILSKADEWLLDTDNYSVWGASAGGHLVASFGTTHMGYPKYALPKPGTLVLTYPVISMREGLTHKESRDTLLGSEAGEERVRFASVDEHVTASYPPVYIWCGDADKTVPPENTRRMAAALEKAGVPYQCDIFPGVDHGVGPGTGTAAEGWIDRAVSFWLERN